MHDCCALVAKPKQLLDMFSCLLICFFGAIGPVGLSQMMLCLKGLGPHRSLQANASAGTLCNHFERKKKEHHFEKVVSGDSVFYVILEAYGGRLLRAIFLSWSNYEIIPSCMCCLFFSLYQIYNRGKDMIS